MKLQVVDCAGECGGDGGDSGGGDGGGGGGGGGEAWLAQPDEQAPRQ